jgi:hypothetical protein
MKNNNPHRKKKFVPGAFKFLVAAGSIAGTVGIWNVLARNDLLQASAQNLDPATATTVEGPLPTVVPLTTVDSVLLPTTTGNTTAPLRDVTVSTTTQSANPSITNSMPATTSNAPAPVTVTQSSKKP